MQYATMITKGGSSMLKGLQTVKAGREQAYKLELESEQDEIATISAEADRKYDLTKALASQVAGAGLEALKSFSGSPLTVMEEDERLEAENTKRADYQRLLRKRVARRTARNVKDTTYFKAGVGLMK